MKPCSAVALSPRQTRARCRQIAGSAARAVITSTLHGSLVVPDSTALQLCRYARTAATRSNTGVNGWLARWMCPLIQASRFSRNRASCFWTSNALIWRLTVPKVANANAAVLSRFNTEAGVTVFALIKSGRIHCRAVLDGVKLSQLPPMQGSDHEKFGTMIAKVMNHIRETEKAEELI